MSNPFAGVDHVGYVVTDLELAGRFAIEVLGFELVADRHGTLSDPEGDALTRRFGIHPRASGCYQFYRAGDARVEFLAWESPDQVTAPARNSDVAGRHLAVAVTDMAAAIARIESFPGTEVREPNPSGFIYVKTPFGLEVQLIPVAGAAT